MKHHIEIESRSGLVITLDQLASFVQEAMRAGIEGDTGIDAQITWKGKLKSVSLTGELEEL